MSADVGTLPRLLQRNAKERGTRPALREKDRGIWQTWTWKQYHDHVRDFALGLASLGFTRGERLSIIGDNRPRLYAAQVAAQCLGGVPVPVYQDSIARELVYVWNHADVSVIVAEDQEQVDKVLALRAELPGLRWIVYDDPRGMHQYRDERLLAYAEVQARGREFGQAHPGYVESEIARGDGDELAMIAYTSGTTGSPKGAMLTHANALATAVAFLGAEPLRADDEYLAYLPMAWVGDAFYTLVLSLYVGSIVSCPESPETVQRDLRELGPTILLAPPRIWENMLTAMQVRAADAPWLKRRVFERFRAAAERAEILRADGKPVPLSLRMALALGEVLVYGPVRDQLGLARTRWCLTGGAPLGPDPAEAAEFTDIAVVESAETLEHFRAEVAPGLAAGDADAIARIRTDYGLEEPIERGEPITVPTLIVAGRQDGVVGYREQWQLVEHYPHATFAVLDRAGHAPPHEQPALLACLIAEWLDRVDDARSPGDRTR